ncbi:MAG: 4-(cytidine 5'-diphospho)-2-C-methyl-D-erythritol kinase [Brevinematia bacterium]
MKLFSRAKINLFLDIVGQDDKDGYHFIDSLFQEVTLCDEIDIEVSTLDKDRIEFDKYPDLSQDSTIHRAINLLRKRVSFKEYFHIRVKKNIPLCAGLGGGSSNAAAVLQFFADRYSLKRDLILEIAKETGSDVPFFLYGGLCRVGGKGEKIEKLNIKLKDIYFIIIYPHINVKTSYAYSLVKDKRPSFNLPSLENISCLTVDFLRKIVYNKFEKFVLDGFPELKLVYSSLRSLLNCDVFFMSGSGSSFVAVYGEKTQREEDFLHLKQMTHCFVSKDEPYYR